MLAHERDRFIRIAVKEADPRKFVGNETKLLPPWTTNSSARSKKSVNFSYTVKALMSQLVKRDVTF